VGEAELGRVALLDPDARIRVPRPGRVDVDLGVVDGGQLLEIDRARQGEGEAAGAAADLEQPLTRCGPGVLDEERREPAAPAAHDLLVAIRIAGVEHRRHGVAPRPDRSDRLAGWASGLPAGRS